MSEPHTEFARLSQSGDEHYRRKEYSIAIECYRAALEKGAGGSGFYFNYAYSLAQMGKDNQAVEIYERAIKAGPGAAAHNNLGLLLRKMVGRLNDARDHFVEATEFDDSDPL